MILPAVAITYDPRWMENMRDAIRKADAENYKRTQDIEMINGKRIILTAPDGGQWALSVDNAGALSTVAA